MSNMELFVRWYAWSLQFKDCDPACWATNYLNKRYEHNDEQKLWFCWLYGNTYHLPTAWVLMNEFPDFELATVDRMTEWNSTNYPRLRYQTDTKWNKGHLPTMFASYKSFIGNRTQREAIDSCKSFDELWTSLKTNLYKFGRYSTWFYMQHLHATANVNIVPTSLMLDDYGGSRSHRNGLHYAMSEYDKIDAKLSKSDIAKLESVSVGILQEMNARFPELSNDINFYTMETALCAFKKIFRTRDGRYLGYYLDRQAEEITKSSSDGWYGIDWQVMWDARQETLDRRLNTRHGVNKEKFNAYIPEDGGFIERIDWKFPDHPKHFYLGE